VGACIRSCSNNTGQKCLSGGSWGQCNGC
jgi:hypothetical protein